MDRPVFFREIHFTLKRYRINYVLETWISGGMPPEVSYDML
jgi:hypothetical protein